MTSPLPATEGEVIVFASGARVVLDAPLKLSPRFERAIEDAGYYLERAIAKMESAAEGQACDRQLRLSLLKIQMETLIRDLRTEGERE